MSKVSYYADFLVVPFLIIVSLVCDVSLRGACGALPVAALIGFAAWTFAEYWIHRSLFHRYYRAEHWLHHKNPAGYAPAPGWWLVSVLHGLAFLFAMSLGSSAATGAFVGFEAGYCAFISVHDAIHHWRYKGHGWLRRRWEHHHLHHSGLELNFGLLTNGWDKMFGTYRNPRATGTFSASRFKRPGVL